MVDYRKAPNPKAEAGAVKETVGKARQPTSADGQSSPPKKIVLFSDGTGNSSASPQKTNVWRTYKALDTREETRQVAFYDNGVGTSSFKPLAVLGLAFGLGLERNVKQIYLFLCRNYVEGDEIYAFGFSRGAFTIRVLVGLIASQGIIKVDEAIDEADLKRLVDEAYTNFRREAMSASLLSPVWETGADGWRWIKRIFSLGKIKQYDPMNNFGYVDKKSGNPPPSDGLITFVGLWDTVDAYGLPVDELTRAWDMVVWPLTAADRNLSPRVKQACHALALDEQRLSFKPMLWNEEPEYENPDRLNQVWFAGVHANVGGGYPDDSLSFVSFNWMLHQVQGRTQDSGKLVFVKEVVDKYKIHADVNGTLYNNRAGVGNLYRYSPRKLEKLCDETEPNMLTSLAGWLGLKNDNVEGFLKVFGFRGWQENKVVVKNPKLHYSVFKRMQSGSRAYAPINLPAKAPKCNSKYNKHGYVVVDDDGRVVGKNSPISDDKLETDKNGPARQARQTLVWNKVWGLKVLYYSLLVVLFAFAIYPFLVDSGVNLKTDVNDKTGLVAWAAWGWNLFVGFLDWLGSILRLALSYVGKIPGLGLLETWMKKYSGLQTEFLGFAIAIGLILAFAGKLHLALRSEMLTVWQAVVKRKIPSTDVSGLRRWIASMLASKPYRWVERAAKRSIEIAAVLLFSAVTIHVFSLVVDGGGAVCSGPTTKEKNIEQSATFPFTASDPCLNTRYRVEKDHKYNVTFEVATGNCHRREGTVFWCDSSLQANAAGWDNVAWYWYAFTPLRRHWFIDWYQPVMRIDNTLFNTYPLDNGGQTPKDPGSKTTTVFKAKSSGVLYLYVNDAVVVHPWLWPRFYSNNNGVAKVTITDLTTTQPGSK